MLKHLEMTSELYHYLLDHNPPLDEHQRTLIEQTQAMDTRVRLLQIPAEQGAFLAFLMRLVGAGQVVEVGTFTGFSALCMARALPPGGRVLTCDVSKEWTAMAEQAWRSAGVADRIELRIGPAIETLRELPREPWVDFAFVDADKESYPAYWEELVPRVRPGGLIVADNVLYHGEVVRPGASANADAIRAFNEQVLTDDRVDSVMLPIVDGLTVARRLAD